MYVLIFVVRRDVTSGTEKKIKVFNVKTYLDVSSIKGEQIEGQEIHSMLTSLKVSCSMVISTPTRAYEKKTVKPRYASLKS